MSVIYGTVRASRQYQNSRYFRGCTEFPILTVILSLTVTLTVNADVKRHISPLLVEVQWAAIIIIIIIIYYLFITPLRQHSKIQADKQYRTQSHKHHAR